MRTKFFILAIVLVGIFSSCKNEKSVDSLEVVKPDVAVAPNHKWLASSEEVQKLYEPPTLARNVPVHCQL